jgi:type IV pilus assembly protein PilW
MQHRTRQSGFTIIELMIAMALGLFLVAGVVTLFMSSRQSFNQDENTARLQDEARFAIQELARDLRMASYLTEPLVPGSITQDGSLTLATDCGNPAHDQWVYDFTDEDTGEISTLTALDNTDGPTAAANYACIDENEIVEDTDVVAIKRAGGSPVPPANLQAGTVYIRSNGTTGLLYKDPPVIAIAGPFNDWEYRPRIYYIRNFTNEADDGVPSLCRKVLTTNGEPSMTTECIAQGIENLQLEYGLDTDSDGSADRYLANPTLAEMQDVVSARVFILARTRDSDRRHTDPKTYSISNAPDYTPADNYHRRVYQVTVTVHNLRNLRRLGV